LHSKQDKNFLQGVRKFPAKLSAVLPDISQHCYSAQIKLDVKYALYLRGDNKFYEISQSVTFLLAIPKR
jgi:hypothetical protein